MTPLVKLRLSLLVVLALQVIKLQSRLIPKEMLKDGIAKSFILHNAHLLKLPHALLVNLARNAQIVFALLQEVALAQLDKLVVSLQLVLPLAHLINNALIAKDYKMMLACAILAQIVLVLAQSALSADKFQQTATLDKIALNAKIMRWIALNVRVKALDVHALTDKNAVLSNLAQHNPL